MLNNLSLIRVEVLLFATLIIHSGQDPKYIPAS